MTLTTREIGILEALHRYRYLWADMIHDKWFYGRTMEAAYKILRKLERAKLIERIPIPRLKGLHVGYMIYLTRWGAETLAWELKVPFEDLNYKPISKGLRSINAILHRKHAVSFVVALDNELATLPQLNISHEAWDWHWVERNGKKEVATALYSANHSQRLIPDMTVVLKNQAGKEALYFVEIDCSTETITGRKATDPASLLGKYLAYETLLASGEWKKQIPTTAQAGRILTVTTSETHIQNIREKVTPHLKYPNLYWFTTHDQVRENGCLAGQHWIGLNGSPPGTVL